MTAAQPSAAIPRTAGRARPAPWPRQVVDIPFDPHELTVDIDAFRQAAPLVRPKLVALGLSMTLFPQPVRAMKEVIADWGGRLFFDAAHQLGLIGGGEFQDPLKEGADIITGSAGKTFSGPQSGIILWDDPEITEAVTTAVFPVWAATHQVNRVAALALATAEAIAYGGALQRQIVRNAQALARALDARGVPMLGAHKGYTTTHQAIADVRAHGRGLKVAQLLERANIIVNKNLLPADRPRTGTIPAASAHRHDRGHDASAWAARDGADRGADRAHRRALRGPERSEAGGARAAQRLQKAYTTASRTACPIDVAAGRTAFLAPPPLPGR
jgi:glycine hydroxymethyltransferase